MSIAEIYVYGHIAKIYVYGHITLKTPVLIWLLKLSSVGQR